MLSFLCPFPLRICESALSR